MARRTLDNADLIVIPPVKLQSSDLTDCRGMIIDNTLFCPV